MVQQRLFVNRVLHLRDFLQVTQLKAFGLEAIAYPAPQSERGMETTIWNYKKPKSPDQIAVNFLFGPVGKRGSMEYVEEIM